MSAIHEPIRFHLSVNVADLKKSVEFFRTLFGMEPAKLRHDYAKFEPDEPPLVLSLEPASRQVGGPLNHVGFRMPNAQLLVAMQERLERGGIRSQRESGVECCYARQTKFWVHDPDGTLWEIYTLDGDIEHRGDGQTEDTVRAAAPPPRSEPRTWEHRLSTEIPTRIPADSESLDEVRLLGTLNNSMTEEVRELLLVEACRVLKPGGRVFIHVLSGESPVDSPNLPGPAGSVRHVPFEHDPVELLERHGFERIRMQKFDAKPCFVRDGIGMRELRLEGWKPFPSEEAAIEVMYKGPHATIIDDSGREFRRGQRQVVPPSVAELLRFGESAADFVVFESKAARPLTATSCST